MELIACTVTSRMISYAVTSSTGVRLYHFYQVKTKGKLNYQWGKKEVFGLTRKKVQKPDDVANSFAGKLMMHTIRFKNSCGSVVFLTNVYLDDELDKVAAALADGDFDHAVLKEFMKTFNAALAEEDSLDDDAIKRTVEKLRLSGGNSYLHPHSQDFEALSRDAIYKFSEIDLQHVETQEIINSLLSLVERKSFSKLMVQLNEDELDEMVGVGISDLLEILSISKGAYEHLRAGGDPSALRNASIIQRKLSKAGASEEILEFCSKSKVAWDVWLREKRHSIHEYEINMLLEKLSSIQNNWSKGDLGFGDLNGRLINFGCR